MNRLVVGLGNPGPQYKDTRHNLGFMVLQRLTQLLPCGPAETWETGVACSSDLGAGSRAWLLWPLTYMNRSGQAVAEALDTLAPEPRPPEILVVTDDIHLPLGRMRLRPRGSPGGHNGLKSIDGVLGQTYPRLRVGVGPVPFAARQVDFVLGAFAEEDQALLAEAVDGVAQAVVSWLREDLPKAQETWNGWVAPILATRQADEQALQDTEDGPGPTAQRKQQTTRRSGVRIRRPTNTSTSKRTHSAGGIQ